MVGSDASVAHVVYASTQPSKSAISPSASMTSAVATPDTMWVCSSTLARAKYLIRLFPVSILWVYNDNCAGLFSAKHSERKGLHRQDDPDDEAALAQSPEGCEEGPEALLRPCA